MNTITYLVRIEPQSTPVLAFSFYVGALVSTTGSYSEIATVLPYVQVVFYQYVVRDETQTQTVGVYVHVFDNVYVT